MFALLRRQKVRNALLQALFVGTIAYIVIGGWLNAQQTMQQQRIVSGFGFLWRSTGWEGNFSLLSATPNDPYWWFFVIGLVNTLFLGTVGLVLATLVGLMIGLARISSNEMLRLLGRIYVDFFRNIPLILQVFFWYAFVTHLPAPRGAYDFGGLKLSSRGIYAPVPNVDGGYLLASAVCLLAAIVVPLWLGGTRRIARPPGERRSLRLVAFLGLLALAVLVFVAGRVPGEPLFSVPQLQGLNLRGGVRISPEFSALVIAMTIYGGAYIGEIVRGGFKAVGRGQVEAAESLGLTPWRIFCHVRLPLALRAMLPILANQYIWLIKATTLGITIGFTDFFMVVAITINQSGNTLEAIGILMAGFLLINLSLAALFNHVNKAIALKGNQLRS
ncbi:amino acid ABC transporter permease [Pseudochelatococcus sp. B33]